MTTRACRLLRAPKPVFRSVHGRSARRPVRVTNTGSSSQGGGGVPVEFRLPQKVPYGRTAFLVGSCEQLGVWNLDGAKELNWTNGDVWQGTVELPVGEEVEYKYVMVDVIGNEKGGQEWQKGPNLRLRADDRGMRLLVTDSWVMGGEHEVETKPLSELDVVVPCRGRMLCGLQADMGDDGGCVVTGDTFGKVGVWGLQREGSRCAFVNKLVFDMDEDVRCLAMMPTEGRRLLSAGGSESLLWGNRGVICLWDLEHQRQVYRLDNLTGAPIHSVAVLNQNVVATGCADNNSIHLWDVRQSGHTRRPVQVLDGHNGGVSSLVSLKRDGQRQLVSGSTDATVVLWDLRLRRPVHVLAGHSGPVTSLNVLEDESGMGVAGSTGILCSTKQDDLLLLSGSEDGTLKLWEKRSNGSLFINRHTYYTPTSTDNGGVCCTSVLLLPPARPMLSRLSAPGALSHPTTTLQLDTPPHMSMARRTQTESSAKAPRQAFMRRWQHRGGLESEGDSVGEKATALQHSMSAHSFRFDDMDATATNRV